MICVVDGDKDGEAGLKKTLKMVKVCNVMYQDAVLNISLKERFSYPGSTKYSDRVVLHLSF